MVHLQLQKRPFSNLYVDFFWKVEATMHGAITSVCTGDCGGCPSSFLKRLLRKALYLIKDVYGGKSLSL